MVTKKSIKERMEHILDNYQFGNTNVLEFITPEELIKDDAINDAHDVQYTIWERINDNGGFQIDIIYYYKAMEYLSRYDHTLCESVEIADELGYQLADINSETLASLHASRQAEEEYNDQTDEFNEIWELIEEYREFEKEGLQ